MSGDSLLDGITDVLNAANGVQDQNSGSIANQLPLGVESSFPSVEELLAQGATEMVENSSRPATPKRKRGRPRGSRNRSAPQSEDEGYSENGERDTRNYINRLGQMTPAESKRAVYLRKKITKIFDYFPHKLEKYYPSRPHVGSMTIQELIDTDQLVCNILDDGDEATYVKEAFKFVANTIERAGPAIQQRFLRWVPGSEILRFQRGLGETVGELVDEPGEEGLEDDVNRIAVEFVGWAPSNPYANLGIKIFKLMQAVRDQQQQATLNSVSTGEDEGL